MMKSFVMVAGQSLRATAAMVTVFLIIFSGAAYGQSGRPAIGNYDEVITNEQSSTKIFDPVLKPQVSEKKEPTGDGTTSGNINEKVPSTKEYVKAFPDDIVDGTDRLFHHDNLPYLVIGSGLTVMAFALDGKAKRESLEDEPLGKYRNFGNTLGDGFVEVGVGGGMYLTGQLLEDKKLADTGIVTLEACLIDGVATEALKYGVRRRRPNGGDNKSFPSGHTSVTAALAASVSEMYDWDPTLAVPLYATVALVGISRMDSNAHYLSDVLAGATVGTLAGLSVAKCHKERSTEHNLSFSPIFEKDCKGFVLTFMF